MKKVARIVNLIKKDRRQKYKTYKKNNTQTIIKNVKKNWRRLVGEMITNSPYDVTHAHFFTEKNVSGATLLSWQPTVGILAHLSNSSSTSDVYPSLLFSYFNKIFLVLHFSSRLPYVFHHHIFHIQLFVINYNKK